MNGASSSNWLQRTRQRWKVAVFGLGIATACSFWVLSYALSRQKYPFWFHFAGVMAMAAAFLWLGSSVRCRACGKSISTWALSAVSVQTWIPSLVRLQRCPVCGDDALSGTTTGSK